MRADLAKQIHALSGLGDHVEARFLQQPRDSLPQQYRVVGDHHAHAVLALAPSLLARAPDGSRGHVRSGVSTGRGAGPTIGSSRRSETDGGLARRSVLRSPAANGLRRCAIRDIWRDALTTPAVCRPRRALYRSSATTTSSVAASSSESADRVLDSLAGALAEVRQHRVGGVAGERDPPDAQALERWPVVEACADDRIRRRGGDEFGDRVRASRRRRATALTSRPPARRHRSHARLALAHQYAWLPLSVATPKSDPRPNDSPLGIRRRSVSSSGHDAAPGGDARVARRPVVRRGRCGRASAGHRRRSRRPRARARRPTRRTVDPGVVLLERPRTRRRAGSTSGA